MFSDLILEIWRAECFIAYVFGIDDAHLVGHFAALDLEAQNYYFKRTFFCLFAPIMFAGKILMNIIFINRWK